MRSLPSAQQRSPSATRCTSGSARQFQWPSGPARHAHAGHYWATEDALLGWLSGSSFRPGPGLRRLEIHDAAADTRCSYSTGQAQTFAADFVRIAEHLPRSIESQLSFLLAHRNAWVARATMILDRAGVGVPVPIGSPNLP